MDNFSASEASEYYYNMAKFIFVAVDMNVYNLETVFEFFLSFKILNTVAIGKFDGTVQAFTYNPFFTRKGRTFIKLELNFTNAEEVFFDKLQDLNGYKYRTLFIENGARLIQQNGKLEVEEMVFMKTVAAKQNAQIEAYDITGSNEELTRTLEEFVSTELADVCLLTSVSVHTKNSRDLRTINTYDTDGFCAIVPHPEIKYHFDFLFKPFDLWSWILIFASMIASATVWRLSNRMSWIRSNTAGYFIYGFVVNFIGQSIPFRQHRPIQKVILQLTILLTFILGTAYQSIVISSMTNLLYVHKIKTIEELINGDYSFYVSKLFVAHLDGSDYYQRMGPRVVKELDTMKLNYSHLASDNIAIVESCSLIDLVFYELHVDKNFHYRTADFYYKLDEKFANFYLHVLAAPFTFFRQRLQELSLRLFENGIKNFWKSWRGDEMTLAKQRNNFKNEGYMMTFDDLAPTFYLLAFGLILSSLTCLLEIFWHDCLSNLKLRNFSNWIRNLKKKLRRNKRHRVIQVRPINQNETEV